MLRPQRGKEVVEPGQRRVDLLLRARPLAAPRTTSIVPSVTMNGTTSSRVMSRPLTRPQAAPTAMPASAARSGLPPALQAPGDHDGPQGDDRSDRQVDPADDDDHRHAERGGADDGGLAGDGLEVVARREALGPDGREERVDDGDERRPARPEVPSASSHFAPPGEPPAGASGPADVVAHDARSCGARLHCARRVEHEAGLGPVPRGPRLAGRPRYMTATRSHTAAARAGSCSPAARPCPRGRELVDQRVDLALLATSMPRVGSSSRRTSTSWWSSRASATFCWLPPDSSATLCRGPAAPDAQPLDPDAGPPGPGGPASTRPTGRGPRGERASCCRPPTGPGQPLRLAVLAQEPDALAEAPARRRRTGVRRRRGSLRGAPGRVRRSRAAARSAPRRRGRRARGPRRAAACRLAPTRRDGPGKVRHLEDRLARLARRRVDRAARGSGRPSGERSRSSTVPATGPVRPSRPSRSTVKRSATCWTSSRKCEM